MALLPAHVMSTSPKYPTFSPKPTLVLWCTAVYPLQAYFRLEKSSLCPVPPFLVTCSTATCLLCKICITTYSCCMAISAARFSHILDFSQRLWVAWVTTGAAIYSTSNCAKELGLEHMTSIVRVNVVTRFNSQNTPKSPPHTPPLLDPTDSAQTLLRKNKTLTPYHDTKWNPHDVYIDHLSSSHIYIQHTNIPPSTPTFTFSMPSRATSTFFDRFDHVDFSWTSLKNVYSFTWHPTVSIVNTSWTVN